MTIIIQIFVILIALGMLGMALGNRSSHSVKAYKKLGLIILAVAMVVAVLFPESTNVVAHAVGVGRGADLLLYLTVAAFILYALNNYLQLQDQRDITYRLARRIAIVEAKNNLKKSK